MRPKLTHAAPRSPPAGRAECCVRRVPRASSFCGPPHRAPRPRAPSICFTTRLHIQAPRGRRKHHPVVLRERSTSAEHLAATAMDKSKLQAFLTERGHLGPAGVRGILLFPGLPTLGGSGIRSRNGSRIHAAEGTHKRSANARPSEGTSSDSESDPGSSDSPDHRVSPRSGAVEPLKVQTQSVRPHNLMGLCCQAHPAPRKPKG
ncbi:hypothetical protein EVAR_88446_1 [Eumeta japonica]|uniref:Uncharacterized protein n=1 Tax=Eumeta variegata TaxID=151549 RepID=A0A4C1SJ93_EUMVA|nr:hypothetical protein EVAR_88446_1 [Eumeta japonica]